MGPFDQSSVAVTSTERITARQSFVTVVGRPCLLAVLRSSPGLPCLKRVPPFGAVADGLRHPRLALGSLQQLDHSFLLQFYNFK